MDPVTIVGLVEGSISLAVHCGSVAKSLNNLAGQYKNAKLTISTMVQNLDIMQLSWDRISAWSRDFMPTDNDAFAQRLERFLETGSLVLDALEEDLRSYNVSNVTFTQRSRLVWNENLLQGHQSRIRDQAQSMSFLLQAIQLPTQQATTNLLRQSEQQFLKSDESAFSMVPSTLSVSTSQTSNCDSIRGYENMVYRRLSFEDDLFTARVYKRNYRSLRLQQLSKQEPQNDPSSITIQRYKYKDNKGITKLQVQLRQLTDGSSTTNEVSSETANTDAELDAKHLVVGAIAVSTSYDISTEEINHNLDYRITLKSGRDGLYVRMVRNLEQRLNPSVSASYMRLVTTCGRGDNNSVKRQLAMMPPTTPESPEIPAFLGSYISGSFYFCPIHAAVFNGHVEVMKTLLRRADLENDLDQVVEKVIGGTENDQWRPPHVATLKSNLSMVRLLLENGASVISRTGYGIQAVHLAARTGSTEILAALFAAGADPNCTDLYGHQPLHYISDSQDLPTVIEYLVERGASIPGIHDADELTLLHMACKNDFPGNLKALLGFGALAGGFPLCQLESALDTAIRYGSALSVQTLLLSLADEKTLPFFLDHVNLLGEDQNGVRFITSLLRLLPKDWTRLLLENLPNHKITEKIVLELKMKDLEAT